MKAFVTGGSGFVGGRLIRRLIRDGSEVAAFARSEAAVQRVETLGAEAVRGSLADVAAMTAGMSGCDVVFHCAAHVGRWGDPTVFRAVNVDGTANVVEAAQAAGITRLVLLSTESVFLDGRELDGIDETMPIPRRGHLSDYAASKAEAELATAGVAPGDASVPGWLMRGVGAAVETTWRILPLKSAPPLNRVEVSMVSHPMVLNDSKARTDLGYVPVISVERGMAELG